MNKFLFAIIVLSLLACSRGNDNPVNPPFPPVTTDSLSAGWSFKSLQRPFAASDVFFINDTLGYASGINWICRSKDGGKSWDSVFYKPNSEMISIGMGSVDHALFVLGPGVANSEIIRTDNGGSSFTSVTLADPYVSNVFFVSPTIVYAIGRKCWKSMDAGSTWTALYEFSTPITSYRGLFFIDQQTGWTTGEDGIHKTTNGGASWQLVPFTSPGFDELFFTDASTGFVTGGAKILKSTDGGASWNLQNTLSTYYHDIHFVSATTGYVTDHNVLLKTTDGGTTWKKEVELTPGSAINELHFTDANHGWACVNRNGVILRYEK